MGRPLPGGLKSTVSYTAVRFIETYSLPGGSKAGTHSSTDMVEYDLGEFGRVWVKRSIAKDGCADASEAIDISARTTAVTQSSVASETSRQPGELLILPAYGRCTQPKTISITAVSRNRYGT